MNIRVYFSFRTAGASGIRNVLLVITCRVKEQFPGTESQTRGLLYDLNLTASSSCGNNKPCTAVFPCCMGRGCRGQLRISCSGRVRSRYPGSCYRNCPGYIGSDLKRTGISSGRKHNLALRDRQGFMFVFTGRKKESCEQQKKQFYSKKEPKQCFYKALRQ